MNIDNEIKKILSSLGLDKLFDAARLVDPKEKKILRLENKLITVKENHCFNFWERNETCDNCISMRALNENKIFVKMEYSQNLIYMITAIPIELHNRRIVIELIKNITDNFSLKSKPMKSDSEIYQLIDNLKKTVLIDTLTGVYNRRYINERLPADIISSVLAEKSMSIIMFDIDYFKKINDSYGHTAGDAILKSCAQTIFKKLKNQGEWIARYGGDEFMICLPGSCLCEAKKMAEEFRRSVENIVINKNSKPVKVTISFGIADIDSVQEKDVAHLIEKADAKLYAAKQNGRNRVES